MNVDVNTPTDDMLETWAMYSQKLFYSMITSKEEIDEFQQVKLALKTQGITNLELHNVFEKECILRYTKQGGEYKKHININK
jgi:hypothetical protein